MPDAVHSVRRAARPVHGLLATLLTITAVAHGAENTATPGHTNSSTPFIARRYFPDDGESSAQGEVRVARLPGGLRIRTLVYSRLLKRVVAELAEKIESGWPPSDPFHDDAIRYTAAVETARDEIWSRWRLLSTRERTERRQNLVIDFIVQPDTAVIQIAIPKLDESGSDVDVVALELLPGPSVAAEFVRAEAIRILRDRFPDRADELVAALAPTGVEPR